MDHSTAGDGTGSVGARYGSASYVAPEQAAGQGADARTDQYHLGLVLCEMVTGHPAFAAQNLRPDLPVAFETVLLKALAPVPGTRHESLYAFGNALLPFASAKASLHWAPTFPPAS